MYCKNCGNKMDDLAVICVKCGAAKGTGANFCPNCGGETQPGAQVCTGCGVPLSAPPVSGEQKSKWPPAAGNFLGRIRHSQFLSGIRVQGACPAAGFDFRHPAFGLHLRRNRPCHNRHGHMGPGGGDSHPDRLCKSRRKRGALEGLNIVCPAFCPEWSTEQKRGLLFAGFSVY